ncbi:MAG: GNAT family N-acetyltransferase [Flavobacteriales bacterium]
MHLTSNYLSRWYLIAVIARMNMTVKNLTQVSFDQILECFLRAFDNYFVPMPQNKTYYQERWKAAKVDFSLSYGMFDNEELIGFIIHAVDTRNGKLTAYNTGTGVLPKHRRKGIVNKMYRYALSNLMSNGVEISTLEVISENHAAIKAYQGIGFNKRRKYLCFKGSIEKSKTEPFEIEQLELDQVEWAHLPYQESYSWDNQKESILGGQFSFYQVMKDKERESFFIINSENGYLTQFDTMVPGTATWERLFSAIWTISNTIRINNRCAL